MKNIPLAEFEAMAHQDRRNLLCGQIKKPDGTVDIYFRNEQEQFVAAVQTRMQGGSASEDLESEWSPLAQSLAKSHATNSARLDNSQIEFLLKEIILKIDGI